MPSNRRGIPTAFGWVLVAVALVPAAAPGSAEQDEIFLPNDIHFEQLRDFQDLIAGDFRAFAYLFDSLLVAHHGSWKSAVFHPVAQAFLDQTADSLLYSDIAYLDRVDGGQALEWFGAVARDHEGWQLHGVGEWNSAGVAFEEAAREYERLADLRRAGVAWGSAGTEWFNLSDFERTQVCVRRALDLRRRVGDPLWIGRALNTLGSIHYQLGEYDSALVYYGEAREVREELERPRDLAITLAYIGNVHFDKADLLEAERYYELALDTGGDEAGWDVRVRAIGGLANVFDELGRHEEAASAYRELIGQGEARGDSLEASVMRKNLASSYLALGKPAEALREVAKARRIQESAEDWRMLTETLVQAGLIYDDLGDLDRALDMWSEAAKLAIYIGHAGFLCEALTHSAQGYSRKGEWARSRELFGQALAVSDSLEDPRRRRIIEARLASWYRVQGLIDSALVIGSRVLAKDQELGLVMNLPLDHLNLGVMLLDSGNRAEGMRHLDLAEELAMQQRQKNLLWLVHLNLADALEQGGDLDGARRRLARAMDLLESERSGSLSETAKAELLGSRSFVYEAQVQVLSKLGAGGWEGEYVAKALEVAERGKARAFLDLLEESRVDYRAHLPQALSGELEQVELDLGEVQYRLRQVEGGAWPADSARVLADRRDDLELRRGRILEEGRLLDPRLGALDPGSPAALVEIREELLGEPGSVLLEYVLGDSASYLWTVTGESVELAMLPRGVELEGMVWELRGSLEREGRGQRGAPLVVGGGGTRPLAEVSRELGEVVLGPALGVLKGARVVYVVADGALQYVPFDLLVGEAGVGSDASSGAGPGYVLAGMPVHYGPSATALVRLSRQAAFRRLPEGLLECLAVGDPRFEPPGSAGEVEDLVAEVRSGLAPLPHTREEVEEIAGLYPTDRRTVLVGEAAREETLEEPGYLGRYRRIHLATHGLVDEEHPERSRLVLSYPEAAGADGYLEASEIYGLTINAELVVLSACETGKGKMVRGEGVLGLPRAFFFAGAPRVVVSLWSVSDEATAVLMQAFYKGMAVRGENPGAALAKAKAELRASERWNHPYYWAAFVLVGPA